VAFDFDFRNFRANFFRPELILAKAARARRRALSKAGAFVRQRAKTSMRKRKAISEPGAPPSAHSGELRKLLFFAYDERSDSVVIGPVVFRAGVVPGLLERGGTVVRKGRNGQNRTLHYRARPYMAPALKAELPKFRELLRGMIN
jgi:hypothetical protein